MHYTMERFELLTISLINAGRSSEPVGKEKIPALLAEYAQEKEHLRLKIMEDVFAAPDEAALMLIIDRYQAVLIRLMDLLHDFRRSLKRQDEMQLPAKQLFDQLNELLCFLQVHYSRYFNNRQKMASIKIEHAAKELQSQITTISEVLRHALLPDDLNKIILRPLENFVQSDSSTYMTAQYIRTAATAFLALDTSAVAAHEGPQLCNLLVSLDYNPPEIVRHYTGMLDRMVTEEDSVQGKIRLLKLQSKEINQAPVHPGLSLYPDLPSLREQLLHWLGEELEFYTLEHTLSAALPTAGNTSEGKIHTTLSVPQLALLFRLLKEEQLITNPNQSELLKTVAAHFTTLHKESFSYGHLHGKYYKIDASTKRSLYDILMRLVHLSRKIG
ncbi:hypothetical protein [Ferruginibacter sp.]